MSTASGTIADFNAKKGPLKTADPMKYLVRPARFGRAAYVFEFFSEC